MQAFFEPNSDVTWGTFGASVHSLKVPPRILPPGEVASYSNHGLALAGAIVEEVSGIPFADYMHEQILTPLEMDRSSFVLPPLPAA